MPAFVYLVPFVALFAASRFTAIIAAVVYAAPVVDQDHRRRDPRGVADDGGGGRSAGVGTWQMITKVQLPMARDALASPPTRA